MRLLCTWDFLGNNSGMDRHFVLQGIIPTQGSNRGLLHCRRILYQLSYQGSPEYDTGTEIIGFVFSNCFRLKAYHLSEIHILGYHLSLIHELY